jgi:hypothetical protein
MLNKILDFVLGCVGTVIFFMGALVCMSGLCKLIMSIVKGLAK